MKSELVQDLIKRNFELSKEIERLKLATDPYYLASIDNLRAEIEKIRSLLIQAKPWVESWYADEESCEEIKQFLKKYNELMGEEK